MYIKGIQETISLPGSKHQQDKKQEADSTEEPNSHACVGEVTGQEPEKLQGGRSTYHDFEVVTGDDHVPVFDPFDGGRWFPGHLALKHDVHGLVGIDVHRAPQERGGNFRGKDKEMMLHPQKET